MEVKNFRLWMFRLLLLFWYNYALSMAMIGKYMHMQTIIIQGVQLQHKGEDRVLGLYWEKIRFMLIIWDIRKLLPFKLFKQKP